MTKTTKAFTLIELLIVIVIIGILAVALIPRLTGAQATARDTARKATLQQVATIISAYTNQEQTPAALTASATPVAIDAAMATTVAAYGNMPIVGPNGTTLYIASGGNNVYVVSTDLEKGNGNSAGYAGATGGFIPGALSSTATGYAIRAQ
jgi:prepilin-type N-terminal cleavage/methylation domain-containing protein